MFKDTKSKIDTVVSEALKYHIENGLPLTENIFRVGSESYYDLFNEARKLKAKDILSEVDIKILEDSDIGLFEEYKGEMVPLDSIMSSEELPGKFYTLVTALSDIFEVNDLDKESVVLFGSSYLAINGFRDVNDLDIACNGEFIDIIKTLDINIIEKTDAEVVVGTEDGNMSFIDIRALPLNPFEFRDGNIDDFNIISKEGYLKMKEFDDNKDDLKFFEAKYHGKEVSLGKPKRGGVKKFFVYVKDHKTGNIKKVSFGDTSGLSAKINNPEARKSFVARHKCDQAKDKTKASYWSCRLPYYAKNLGISGGGQFFW